MQNDYNTRALQLLTGAGIQAEILYDVLAVNRTSMVNYYPDLDEGDAYDAVLKDIRAEFPGVYVHWSGRTDEWLGVSFYPKG